MYIVYTPYIYICIFTHRHFKTDLYLKHMMVWLWKSPIPLKGKDKHDTQTLRLTFLFVAVFYQVDFLCVLPLKNDFLPVYLRTFLGRVVCWITAEDLPTIGLRDGPGG